MDHKNLPDQLILEFYTPGEPNSGWIHCSWIEGTPRASYLHAYKSEGKTKYKPILGSAKACDILNTIKLFNKIDTVVGHCAYCESESILVAIVSDFYRCTNCGHDTRQHINGI